VKSIARAVQGIRGLNRGYKFGLLMIAVWTLALSTTHPIGALLIAGPVSALFLLATTGSPASPPAVALSSEEQDSAQS
jgi:uncharacterized protein (DUF58 family)